MPIQPSRYRHLAPTSCKEAIEKWPERYKWPSHEELSQLAQEDFVKITFLDKVGRARLPAQALLLPIAELLIMHGSALPRLYQCYLLDGCVQSGMPVGGPFCSVVSLHGLRLLHLHSAGDAVCLSGKATDMSADWRREV